MESVTARLFRAVVRPRIISYTFRTTRSLVPAPSSRHVKGSYRAASTISSKSPSAAGKRHFLPYILLASGFLAAGLTYSRPAHAEAPPVNDENPSDIRKIRLDEVHEHNRDASTYWAVKGTRVYDITEWVPHHPGGDVILRAAGGNVDQYWEIFSIHKKQDVYDILEQYFIGVIDPQDLVDGKVPSDEADDPFKTDPERHSCLRVLSDRPCSAETPCAELNKYITPNQVFYVRNHLWVPDIPDESSHSLTVQLYDGTEKTYTMSELRNKFREHTITAIMQCSGNRRSNMTSTYSTAGLQWDVGAIGNAHWTGVLLRDVLADAGFDINEPSEDVKHAQFSGEEAYGASIPIDKAIDRKGDVLLAYAMNGTPIPKDHGFPLRVIVPGHVAARSVKWVKQITLSDEESTAQWQRRDYKCFGPNEKGDKVDWDSAQAIQEMPVQSAITRISRKKSSEDMSETSDGNGDEQVQAEGYAFAGGGRRIIRVDVSADDGNTWDQATLLSPTQQSSAQLQDQIDDDEAPPDAPQGHRAWAWQRWTYSVPKDKAEGATFLVKATDEGYNTQPNDHHHTWNFKGNLATAWHRVPFDSKPPEKEKGSDTKDQ